MREPIRFFGLLYIDRKRNNHANLRRSAGDAVEIYISCACLAAKSAKSNGIDFSIFTNEPDLVLRRLRERDLADIPVLSLDFQLGVPEVKVFYSAHFKIDVIAALGTGRYGKKVALVDVDTVFCSAVPNVLSDLPHESIAVYDVSWRENCLHWDSRIPRDLSLVAGRPLPNPKWYGGEFLLGGADAFAVLAAEIAKCWPQYVQHARRLHHVGDEAAVSAALNVLAAHGYPIVDVAGTRTVIRWWSTGSRFSQPEFTRLADYFVLHLPADKEFLAEQANHSFGKADFMEAYRDYFRHRARRWRFINHFRTWNPARI